MPIQKQGRAVPLRTTPRAHIPSPPENAVCTGVLQETRQGQIPTTGGKPAGPLPANREANPQRHSSDRSSESREESVWRGNPVPFPQKLEEYLEWLDSVICKNCGNVLIPDCAFGWQHEMTRQFYCPYQGRGLKGAEPNFEVSA